MVSRSIFRSVALSIAIVTLIAPFASADITSPSIKDKGKQYSKEKPLSSYYGTGNSGRLSEASELRMVVDDLLAAGEFDKAIPKAKKAVQLDPGDPSGHLLLAKCLSSKLYQSKEEIDEKLLAECVREWQIIRYHDADPSEQWEAGNQVKQLSKIAKALEKEKRRKEKDKEKESTTSVAKNDKDNSPAPNKVAEKPVNGNAAAADTTNDAGANDKRQIAEKKRRFGIF